MVLHLSDLEPIQDFTAPNSNNDQDKIEHTRKKEMKKNNTEIEADSSSSDHSCFVAIVTDSNLYNDALYLPQHLTNSAGFSRKCREIVVTDEKERSWALDLRFNKSSDTFYISRGWRSFCDENGKKPGGAFVFKLIGNRETPLLSFCSKEPINDRTQQRVELERKKKRLRCGDSSTSPRLNRFVTLTLTDSSIKKGRLGLPFSFTREIGLDKHGTIILLGKDGSKFVANLRRESTGRMFLGRGLNDFIKANGIKSGESFTLESTWENGTPMLSLFSTESTSETRQQGECSEDSEKKSISIEPSSGNKTKKAKKNIQEKRDSPSAIQNQFVKLTLTHEDVRDCKLILPSEFMKANGINKLGKITLLGKNGMNWFAYILSKNGFMAMGSGWKSFCEANGVKTGESFTLECIHEQDTTLVFKFSSNSEKFN